MNISKKSALTAIDILLNGNISYAKKLEVRKTNEQKQKYIQSVRAVVIYTRSKRDIENGTVA